MTHEQTNNYTPDVESDPIPFNILILSILGINKVKFDLRSYGTNNRNNVNTLNLNRLNKSNRYSVEHPFIDISLLGNEHKVFISDYLISDIIFSGNNRYNLSGKRYLRRIEHKLISDINTNILVFNIQRNYDPEVPINNQVVIPDEYLNINGTDQRLILTGIVTRTDRNPMSGHYTARILCNNKWYFYNDLGGVFNQIGKGSYDEMIKYKNTKSLSVLCLYQKKNI